MLERFETIHKIGLFEDYLHSPSSDLGEVTLIYGENGVGKSTLAAILDSLRERNAGEIIRRRSLPGDVAPNVSIVLGGKIYSFDGDDWNDQPPHDTLDVFYPGFVSRNVHTATGVDSDHRRHLCELVLGRIAVEKVTRLASADKEARAALEELRDVQSKLQFIIKKPDTFETFLGLARDANVDERLDKVRTELKQAQSKDAILTKAVPAPVRLPTIARSAVVKMLEMSTDGIGVDVATVIKLHIVKHLDTKGEDWLAYGANHIEIDNRCPFCAQDLTESSLAKAIRAYFSAEYRAYTKSLSSEIEAIRGQFNSDIFAHLQAAFLTQMAIAAQWEEVFPIDQSLITATLSEAKEIWKSAESKLEAVIATKKTKPLEKAESIIAEDAFGEYERAVAILNNVNTVLVACREKAEERKATISKADITEIELRLHHLENQKTRFEPLAIALLKRRDVLLDARHNLEKEKIDLKKEIDKHAATVVGKYQAGINHYLNYFGCDIRIESVEPSFPSGRASVQYKLKAHGHEIELGLSTAEPSFETVLSEGDKNTLALSFFFARLKDYADLTGRTVILDDPVNSLGFSRRCLIEGVIRDLRIRGAQIIVLTHDERLAAMMWRDKKLKVPVPLQVERTNSGSQLKPWDVERATQSEYVKDYLSLHDYLERGGDYENVARCIRPYVEQRLRHLFPGPPFLTRDTLGIMIDKIRGSTVGARLYGLKAKLPILEAINDASLPSHHASDDVPSMPPPTPESVRVYAQKALEVLE